MSVRTVRFPGHKRGTLWRRGAAAVVGAAVLNGVVLSGSPASAETLPLPLSGKTLISGHGYGHGHGMSQWGAYGAATKGLTHQQILAFYYPGTNLVKTKPGALRVRVSAVPTATVTAMMRPGLTLTASGSTVALGSADGGTRVEQWRLAWTSAGQNLQWRAGGVWKTSGAFKGISGTPAFTNPIDQSVRILRTNGTFREYPNRVNSVRNGASLMTVVATTMETYLRGVVPNEMPASWHGAALRSQAVAARTYAAYEQQHQASSVYDVCDTTSCQVYDGLADYWANGSLIETQSQPNTDEAISATAGLMVSYQRAAAFTQFSAANGGWTSAGSVPYLVSREDPYDGAIANSANTWSVSHSSVRTTLQDAYPSVGTLRSLIVVRDGNGEWGGRIRGVTLVGSWGRVTMPWDRLRGLLGLKSEWFTVTNGDFLRKDTSADGNPDLFGRTADGLLYRLPVTGSALGSATKLGGGWNSMRVLAHAGDLNGSGTADVLAQDTAGALWCYPVPETGSMSTRTPFLGPGGASVPATVDRIAGVGDVTSDGRSDVLAIDRSTGTLWLYAGNGACGFTSRSSLGGGWNAMDLVVGASDLTGDGRADLFAREKATGVLWTYRLNGAGAFVWPRVRVGAGWNVMSDIAALGEINAAGGSDLFARDSSGKLWIYPGAGDGTLGVRRSASGSVSDLAILR